MTSLRTPLYLPSRRLPSFQGARSCRDYSFELGDAFPAWLHAAAQQATFLGAGVSSWVWDLHNGYVLKITHDPSVVRWNNHLMKNPHSQFPSVWAVFQSYLQLSWPGQTTPLASTVIIQSRYRRFSKTDWTILSDTMQEACRDRFEPDGQPAFFSRFQGYNCYEVEAIHHLQSWRRVCTRHEDPRIHQLIHGIDFIIPYFRMHRDNPVALDIDHIDNWAQDTEGRWIWLDPTV